jgi:hypothetical protein
MSLHGKPTGPAPRTKVRRLPARGSYDREAINAILDEALLCHVGFVDDDQPVVIPTIHVRIGGRLASCHDTNASRMPAAPAFGGLPDNPYDGHTLAETLTAVQAVTGVPRRLTATFSGTTNS